MSVAALVAELQARGVILRPDGAVLKVRPVSLVSEEELETLRRHKAEVMGLLTGAPPDTTGEVRLTKPALTPPDVAVMKLLVRHPITLAGATVREELGPTPDQTDLAIVTFEVMAAVVKLEAGITTGRVLPRQLIRGRPLADWLDLDEVARLLRTWTKR